MVQLYLVSVLASGGPGAQVRALLSGLALVAKLRLFDWVCPALWWRLPKVGVKSVYVPRYKGTPRLGWFKGLLEVRTSPSDFVVIGVCILAVAFGFRVFEAQGLCDVVLEGGGACFEGEVLWFKPSKRGVARCIRPVTSFLVAWLRFLVLVAQVVEVRVGEAWCSLVRRSGLPYVSFHGWRRAFDAVLSIGTLGGGCPGHAGRLGP